MTKISVKHEVAHFERKPDKSRVSKIKILPKYNHQKKNPYMKSVIAFLMQRGWGFTDTARAPFCPRKSEVLNA